MSIVQNMGGGLLDVSVRFGGIILTPIILRVRSLLIVKTPDVNNARDSSYFEKLLTLQKQLSYGK